MPNFDRKDMPQVKTQDLGKALDMVADKVRVSKETISASKLKKSQKQLYTDKVKGIASKFSSPKSMKPLIISKDNHIVDGHHRWGAAIYKWGDDVKLPVYRIHLSATSAIKLYSLISKSINEVISGLREAITIPIEIGDTVLGGKFKNKPIVVKSIDKNEKGDITINGKPLLKFRLKEGVWSKSALAAMRRKPMPGRYFITDENGNVLERGLKTTSSVRSWFHNFRNDYSKVKVVNVHDQKKDNEVVNQYYWNYKPGRKGIYIEEPPSGKNGVIAQKYVKYKEIEKELGLSEKSEKEKAEYVRGYNPIEEKDSKRDYKKEYEKYGKSEKAKKYRAELNKYNRQKGTYGNGDGKDASHKGGKIVGFEDESKNRGRREKSRLKKEGNDQLEMMKLLSKAMKTMPGSPKQKKIKQELNKLRIKNGLKPIPESTINEFGGVRFDAIGYDKNGKEVDMYLPRANNGFVKNIVNAAADKLFKGGKGVEYIEVYYDKHHLGTIKKPRTFTKGKDWGKLPINEIPMGDLQKIDTFADKKLNPVDVVITDKHFFDRLNDPRNGKEITSAELIGFFKRLSKHKKEFVEFLNKYNSVVAVDDRTNINIPFMKRANKAIAKTVMRKKDFKTPDQKLDI
jgi:hypothetical protein